MSAGPNSILVASRRIRRSGLLSAPATYILRTQRFPDDDRIALRAKAGEPAMWKRERKSEWVPWYRARNYKGTLTEADKSQLDAFRTQSRHPAAQSDDLPKEVQDYIGHVEMELYDKKQEMAAGRALVFSVLGAALLYLGYKGCLGTQTLWSDGEGDGDPLPQDARGRRVSEQKDRH
jgi:hypothetical protein